MFFLLFKISIKIYFLILPLINKFIYFYIFKARTTAVPFDAIYNCELLSASHLLNVFFFFVFLNTPLAFFLSFSISHKAQHFNIMSYVRPSVHPSSPSTDAVAVIWILLMMNISFVHCRAIRNELRFSCGHLGWVFFFIRFQFVAGSASVCPSIRLSVGLSIFL